MLSFDPKVGITISDIADVRADTCAMMQNAFTEEGKPTLNTEVSTPAGQLADSMAAAIVQKDNELLFLANQFNPLTAEGQWQDALGKIYFLTRHPAIASQATVRCSGAPGTVIVRGAKIRSKADETLWTLQETIVINDESYADGVFTCTQTGPIAAAAHTLGKIMTTTPGWDTADNEQPATTGQDEESQASFENRRYKSVALNSRSSLQSAYSRVAALDGVIAVAVRQNRTERLTKVDGVGINPHSVYVCVLGGADEEIAQALYETVSAGCEYTGTTEIEVKDSVTRATDLVRFSRPTELSLKLVVYLVRLATTSSTVEDEVKDIIYQNFYGMDAAQPAAGSGLPPVLRVTMDTELYSSRFTSALVNAGINYVTKVQMAMPKTGTLKEQLTVPINVCPTLSRDDITIIWQSPAPITDGAYFGFDNPKGDNGLGTGFDQGPFYNGDEQEGEESGGATGGDSGGNTDSGGGVASGDGTESGAGTDGTSGGATLTLALDSAINVATHIETVAPQTVGRPRTPRRHKGYYQPRKDKHARTSQQAPSKAKEQD